MAQWAIEIDLINISPADSDGAQISGIGEIMDDAMDGAFADPDECGEFAESDIGLLSDADQHMGMVGEEGPGGPVRFAVHKDMI